MDTDDRHRDERATASANAWTWCCDFSCFSERFKNENVPESLFKKAPSVFANETFSSKTQQATDIMADLVIIGNVQSAEFQEARLIAEVHS
jgi:hypothetical protein